MGQAFNQVFFPVLFENMTTHGKPMGQLKVSLERVVSQHVSKAVFSTGANNDKIN